MPDEDEPMSEVDATEDESEQALLPKSFFAGKDLEIGSKCEIRVEGIYDGEVAVSYVPKKKDKDGNDKDSDDDDDKSKPKRDSMDGAMREMDMMAMSAPPAPGGY